MANNILEISHRVRIFTLEMRHRYSQGTYVEILQLSIWELDDFFGNYSLRIASHIIIHLCAVEKPSNATEQCHQFS